MFRKILLIGGCVFMGLLANAEPVVPQTAIVPQKSKPKIPKNLSPADRMAAMEESYPGLFDDEGVNRLKDEYYVLRERDADLQRNAWQRKEDGSIDLDLFPRTKETDGLLTPHVALEGTFHLEDLAIRVLAAKVALTQTHAPLIIRAEGVDRFFQRIDSLVSDYARIEAKTIEVYYYASAVRNSGSPNYPPSDLQEAAEAAALEVCYKNNPMDSKSCKTSICRPPQRGRFYTSGRIILPETIIGAFLVPNGKVETLTDWSMVCHSSVSRAAPLTNANEAINILKNQINHLMTVGK